jgi:hypothetical protein
VDNVPFSYVQKANRQWWKYTIAQTFPAYTPMEIEQWSADVILEHLAAVKEIKRQQ